MNDDKIRILHDTDTNVAKIKDDMRMSPERIRVVTDNNLKEFGDKNTFMKSPKPQLNEDFQRRSPVNNFAPNLNAAKMMENDINLLANPHKIGKFSSGSEDSDTESSESSSSGMGTAQDSTNLLGSIGSQDDDDDDETETDTQSGQGFNPFSQNENEDTETGTASEDASTVSSTSGRRMPPQRQKSAEEIAQEKQELLYRLERMEKSGFKAARKFTMASNIEDIKFEYERIKKQRDVDKSIKFQRKILMAVCSGIEFLNGKFDPFDVKLDGWSESIYENLDEYDDVFEELHEKYKEKVKMAPELKLVMMVGGSAFMFHLTNTLFKSKMPGLGDILQQNPELAKNVQQAAMNTMRQNESKSGNADPLFGMMMNQAQNMMNNKSRMGPGVREMKGPSGVDDILGMINKKNKSEDTISSVSSQESVPSANKVKIKMKSQKNPNGKLVLDL